MVKKITETGRRRIIYWILAGILVFINILVSPACSTSQEIDGSSLTSIKTNDKIDSQLTRLIQAETEVEMALLAEQGGIVLNEQSVRVIVECFPGRIEDASDAADAADAEIETSYGDLLQILVPVKNLITLAEDDSVKFIRLPMQPLPGNE